MTVVRTRCTVCRGGRNIGDATLDTIFIEGVPHLVFEWQRLDDGSEKPSHLVALNPTFFHPWQGWGDATFIYESPVNDPRQPN